jgi:SNF2 family DNA or RNA helicase
LIIGPVALIRQWEEELRDKVRRSYRFNIFLLHGQNKASIDELLRYDIVLTTYGTIASQKKQLDKFLSDNADKNIDTKNHPFLANKCPLLHPHKAKFWRVILDEAQNIKNENTKQSVACATIMAEHRWCLTGTPMMNSVKELYSLIRFLRIKPYNDRTKFSETFRCLYDSKGSIPQAMSKLRALVKAIMLRRLKSSVIDGKPILQLPPKIEHVVYAQLTEDEQQFYNQLQHNSQVQFSKYLRAGTVGKNYSNILVLLLRLRQACCHPHLNLDVDEAPSADGASVDDLTKLAKNLEDAVVRRIKEHKEDSLECPICYDIAQAPLIMTPCGHYACKECLSSMYDVATRNRAQNDNANGPKTIPCPYCKVLIDVDKSIPFAVFEQVHMSEKVAAEASNAKTDDANGRHAVYESGSDSEFDSESEDEDAEDADKYGNLKDFVVADSDDDEDYKGKKRATTANPKQSKRAQRPHGSRRGKGQPQGSGKSSAATSTKASELKQLRAEGSRNMEAKRRYFKFLSQHWLSSAKVEECVRLLREFQQTGEKTIVFSQWTCLLDLVQVAMRKGGIGRAYRYDGSMSAVARNESAHRFRDSESREKVMLVSLKAGNAGLNLTAASRVIIMDPFWNPYVEMQAVDRAYRIGQTKEVQVYRILVQDTVEDKIIALQDKKKELVESALDEAGGKAIGRLTTAELKFMFGL